MLVLVDARDFPAKGDLGLEGAPPAGGPTTHRREEVLTQEGFSIFARAGVVLGEGGLSRPLIALLYTPQYASMQCRLAAMSGGTHPSTSTPPRHSRGPRPRRGTELRELPAVAHRFPDPCLLTAEPGHVWLDMPEKVRHVGAVCHGAFFDAGEFRDFKEPQVGSFFRQRRESVLEVARPGTEISGRAEA